MYTSFDNIGMQNVLTLLKSHKSKFLSGQDLSNNLKISRVAVWKHIKKIRTLGYEIESKQNLGYKLVDKTHLLLPWELTENLNTKLLGRRVYYFDSIDSTQNFASEIGSSDRENGTIIIAKRQTSGKGRLKRKWSSPTGGIWMSIIIQPKFDTSFVTLIPIAASLALCKAIEKTFNIKPELKWPNDVTLNGKKLAGILLDTSLESNKISNLILGVGINFKINPSKLKKTLRKTPNFYGVTTLVEKNDRPVALIQQFLYELESVLLIINSGNIRKILTGWTQRSSTIGKNISTIIDGEKIDGKATRLDSDGALIITTRKKIRKLFAGDVIHKN